MVEVEAEVVQERLSEMREKRHTNSINFLFLFDDMDIHIIFIIIFLQQRRCRGGVYARRDVHVSGVEY